MDQVRPKYGTGAPKIWNRCTQNMDQVHQKYGSGAPKIWIRCAQNMDQVRPKYGSGAPKIWIRCTQNSLKKLEGAEVSMQLRGLKWRMTTL
jgi:superfamily I DNA and/or RNA helicase